MPKGEKRTFVEKTASQCEKLPEAIATPLRKAAAALDAALAVYKNAVRTAKHYAKLPPS